MLRGFARRLPESLSNRWRLSSPLRKLCATMADIAPWVADLIMIVFGAAHTATGLCALLFEIDLLYTFLLDTAKFDPSPSLIPTNSPIKAFMRCALPAQPRAHTSMYPPLIPRIVAGAPRATGVAPPRMSVRGVHVGVIVRTLEGSGKYEDEQILCCVEIQ